MHSSRIWLALSLLAGASSSAAAQRAALEAPDLRAYVQDVLDRNDAYRADRLRVAAASERIRPAGALPDPMVTIGAMSLPVPSFDATAEAMTQFPIGVQQRFPFPGKQHAATEAARADSALGDARTLAGEANLVADAAAAFFAVAYAGAALDVWSGRADLARQAIAVATTRYETGAAPQTDLLRARLRAAELAEERHDLEAQLAGARARADAFRGGTGDSIAVVLPAPPTEALPPVEDLRQRVAAGSPALIEAAHRVERDRRVERVFAVAGRPDFTVTVQNGIRFGGREPFLTGLVGISVPLWAGRKQSPAARAATLDADASEAAYEDLLARLTARAEGHHAHLDGLAARLAELTNEIVPLAEAASTSALQRYRVGEVVFSTVLDAQDDTFRARLRVAHLIADYGIARARLAALVGERWYE